MKPIRIRIRKKTRVPTKRQYNHQYRSDWVLVGVIDYSQSTQLFKHIRTEAQFAKYIYDYCGGSGIYSCIYWRKGNAGFNTFWKAKLDANGWMRLPTEKKESTFVKDIKTDLQDVEKRKQEAETEKEKRDLEEEKAELTEELDTEKLEDSNKKGTNLPKGPYPFVKPTKPPFRYHDYEAVGSKKTTQTTYGQVEEYY